MPLSDDQRDIFPTRLELRRIDPAQNMKRFYHMQVQPDLFGGTSLIREWGRIGSRGRVLVEHHADEGQAISALLSRARIKGRRGYAG